MSADDISLAVKTGDMDTAPSLNKIEHNVKQLLKEAVVPELIYYTGSLIIA